MSEQVTHTGQADPALNGKAATAPPDEQEQDTGTTPADRALGVLVAGLGLFLIFVGVDRITGGMLSGAVVTYFMGGADGPQPG